MNFQGLKYQNVYKKKFNFSNFKKSDLNFFRIPNTIFITLLSKDYLVIFSHIAYLHNLHS